MTVLLDAQVPRTLESLVARLEEAPPDGRVEVWCFEGPARRREAERRLAARGIRATVRSAYKPLLHFFLEELEIPSLRRVTVRYPVHERADRRRFLAETYPLTALLRGVETRLLLGETVPEEAALFYDVEVEHRSGTAAGHRVFAPNRLHEDHLGAAALSPTGWLRITPPQDGAGVDGPVDTDVETIFWKIVAAVRAHAWAAGEPYFEQLVIRAEIPGAEQRLPYGDECLSTSEALHEDVYFSLLEIFKQRAGRSIEDRTSRPGQIVPDIRHTDGAPHVRVALEPYGPAEPAAEPVAMETADRAPGLDQVSAELRAIEGVPFAATSRQDRPVTGVYHRGDRPAIVVTAGQHANETSGVVGALRAARRLAVRPGAHFAVIPVENPDGYALHRRLCAANPRHMHHAARYTAFGDDLGSRTGEPWGEKGARLEARRLSGADLHVNLHGYPAHEWTRPLTGFLPRGFERWAVPKGFYLIVRHHAGWGERAAAFLERLTERLGAVPDLAAFNRGQLETYRAYAGEGPFPVHHGVPVNVAEDGRQPFPLTLITEYPDETIYGEAFLLAHTVQMETVLAAEEIHAALKQEAG